MRFHCNVHYLFYFDMMENYIENLFACNFHAKMWPKNEKDMEKQNGAAFGLPVLACKMLADKNRTAIALEKAIYLLLLSPINVKLKPVSCVLSCKMDLSVASRHFMFKNNDNYQNDGYESGTQRGRACILCKMQSWENVVSWQKLRYNIQHIKSTAKALPKQKYNQRNFN